MNQPPPTPLGLYIHIPWCTRKCPYCDFNSHTKKNNFDEAGYVQQLINNFRKSQPWIHSPISSIFIGGGTPSLFTPSAISRLLDQIDQISPLSPSTEITMEANPGSLSSSYCKALAQSPVNRLSIGIQSFNNTHLQSLGRIHDTQQAHQAISAANEAGFSNINVDLMYGLPNQTIAMAIEDIETAINYPINHLSWYQLTIEPNTLFYKQPPAQPNNDALYNMQEAGQERLRSAGFESYEISAYGKNNARCHHNMNYWLFGDYIGIGAGAHGKITNSSDHTILRYWNHKHPKKFLHCTEEYYAELKTLTNKDKKIEFMMNTLRLNQPITYDLFEKTTGLNKSIITTTLLHAEKQMMVECFKDEFIVTPLGRRFTNDLICEFF